MPLVWQARGVNRAAGGARGGQRMPASATSGRSYDAGLGAGSRAADSRGVVRPRVPARLPEDRYHPGARRTGAEPLRASWRPRAGHTGVAGSGRASAGSRGSTGHAQASTGRARASTGRAGASTLSQLAGTYGWRMYALPILMVLTVVV
ncbi:MAG: hypothetical protein ACRDSE_07830, partial [Pseudonocardiaceae bacterium]